MKILKELLYSQDHEWVKVEGNKAYIGISDFAQNALGSIVFVELPQIDDEISVGDTLGAVESVKAASDMYMPVSGTVIEINENLEDSPELINEDCYENWMLCVELSNSGDLEKLMKAEAYEAYCAREA